MEGEPGSVSKKPTMMTAIVILATIIAVIIGYFVWRNFSQTPEEKAAEVLEKASQTSTLPTIDPSGNPAENLPTVNPVDQINPFGKTYKNPF